MLANSSLSFATSSEKFSDIDAFMDRILIEKVEEEHIPNLAITVIADGEVIFEKGFGFANFHDGKKVDPETTMFRMGSVSKLFTWTAIMQLVEQGKLDIHTDINHYLDIEIPEVLEGGGNESEPKPITLFHLMTHTPGFEDYSSSIFRLSSEEMPPLAQYVREYMPARIFPAGEVVVYSNYGTALAGYIVEHISGMPYSEYIDENILKPLGMNHSTFQQPLPMEISSNLAQAYRYIDGEYREGGFEYVPGPAGALSSSSADMAKFMQMYLEGGSWNGVTVLQEATVQQMFEQQFTHHPRLDGMALGFIEKTINDERVLFHGGSTTLFDTGLYLLPKENVGLFISYSGGNYLTHTEVFQVFMDHYYPVNTSVMATPPEGMKERSRQYVGEYHQNRKSITDSDKSGSLTMGIIKVQVDDTGHLLVTQTQIGETNRFIEIEPGIYQNLREGRSPDAYGEFRNIIFQKDPNGNMMLATDGPMTYSKAPWYATSGFTFLSVIVALLLFVGSITFWGIKTMMRRNRPQPKLATWAKSVSIVTGILLLFLIVGIVLVGEFDPIYQLPKIAFGILPAWSPIVAAIPTILPFLGVVMLIFTVLLWKKKYWNMIGRVHYSLLTIMILNFIWIITYWKF